MNNYHITLDTNVILGYLHDNDRLHEKSKKLLNVIEQKNYTITYYEKIHKRDFYSAITNRVNENVSKLSKVGLWDVNFNGNYVIKNLDELKERVKQSDLSESDKGWIWTILEYENSIDDLRDNAMKYVPLIINELINEFQRFIDKWSAKRRIQFFHEKEEKNSAEKNEVFKQANKENNPKLIEYFERELNKATPKGKKPMGIIDKELLILTFFSALIFPNYDYLFVTDDNHMNPKTDKVDKIFARLFITRTIDDAYKLLK